MDATLTLRLTSEDRALLDELVALRNADLAVEGMEATAASFVRGLIRREAVAKGLLEGQSIAHSERAPLQRARAAKG